MAEKNVKLTLFEKEQIETAKKIVEYKTPCEANITSILYKRPELFYDLNLTSADFTNDVWKTYFSIAYGIVALEKKSVLDSVTVGIYLEKHSDLQDKYEKYGGYATISTAMEYVNEKNLDGYIRELRKWKTIIALLKNGFPVKDKLPELIDKSTEDIYNEYSAYLNHIFSNIDSEIKSYDICYKIHDLIESLDEGMAIGLPYCDMEMLTKETGGQYLGSITLLGGISNAGKSTVARSTTLPSIIKLNEKIVVFVNEDSVKKWQREMLVWICNNILNYDIQKYVVRDGKYSEEVKTTLHKAASWLEENTENHKITIIPFLQYRTDLVIKQIRKYAAMGVKYFMLDTFKMDAGRVSANSWAELQQNMVAIHDTVKEEALNVHILITFQLEKGSAVQRYYTQNNIGVAKNIVDPVSTCIMIRDVFEDEYADEKRALPVYRLEGKNGKTKIQVKLEKNKNYQIFFIVKNREGSAGAYQIVAEHDKSRNIIKEVGITKIRPDSF